MRLRSLADDDQAGRIGSGTGASDEQRLSGDDLVRIGALRSADLDKVERRRQRTGESMAEAALALGLTDRDALARATERQQHFVVLAPGDAGVDPLVVTAFDPTDPLAQAARRLRATLSAMTGADGEPLRIVVLLAVGTRAETALIAANLAVACAQTGYATLLVDANGDAPVQHELFRVSNRIGLSTLLAHGPAGDAIQPTAIDGLSILPSGATVRNFAELLDRAGLYAKLRDLADDYDLVLVDASHDDPDIAVAAAEGTDGALVVLRRDASSMQQLKSLVAQLEGRGAPVLGTVLTD